jgi:protein-disulfide isomerase
MIRPMRRSAVAAVFWTISSIVSADGLTAQQGEAILNELRQIHQLLERQLQGAAVARPIAAPVDEKVTIRFEDGGYSIGRADAPLTLVEYTDYQCPFCRQFHITTFDEIKKNYIDTGKLRYVSRDFPLAMHENAKNAALAAHCAAEQGKFWELRHVMIVNANQLQPKNIGTYSSDLNLNVEKLTTCIASGKYAPEVERSLAEGQSAGVSGTPSFILGRAQNGSIDGIRIVGALPYNAFDAKLKEMLAKAPAQ